MKAISTDNKIAIVCGVVASASTTFNNSLGYAIAGFCLGIVFCIVTSD